MKRSRLRNRFLKNRSEENGKLFCKQRISAFHFCENLKWIISKRQTRKTLQITSVSRKTVKPFLSKQIHLPERINLTKEENNSLLTNCEEVVKELSNFFANAVKNLNIPNYENCDSLAEKIDDPSLKAIADWRNHLIILAITSEYENRENFSFNFVSKEDVLKEIQMLDVSKPFRKVTFRLKLLRQMGISLQNQFAFILTNHYKMVNFLIA